GMHLFEFALRDFMNIERYASPASLVVVDDIYPNHVAQTERLRRTRAWTGDVWKLVPCLRKYRPDLTLVPLDSHPTGLLLVANLDPGSTVLRDNYNAIVREFRDIPADALPPDVLARKDAMAPDDPRLAKLLDLLRVNTGKSTVGQLRPLLAGWRSETTT